MGIDSAARHLKSERPPKPGLLGHHTLGGRGRKGSFHLCGGFKVFITQLPNVVKTSRNWKSANQSHRGEQPGNGGYQECIKRQK